jgi:hypothetical protein
VACALLTTYALDGGAINAFARICLDEVDCGRLLTVAERVPIAKDYTGARPGMLVAESAVFSPPNHSVSLHDHCQWWNYVKGADRATSPSHRRNSSPPTGYWILRHCPERVRVDHAWYIPGGRGEGAPDTSTNIWIFGWCAMPVESPEWNSLLPICLEPYSRSPRLRSRKIVPCMAV